MQKVFLIHLPKPQCYPDQIEHVKNTCLWLRLRGAWVWPWMTCCPSLPTSPWQPTPAESRPATSGPYVSRPRRHCWSCLGLDYCNFLLAGLSLYVQLEPCRSSSADQLALLKFSHTTPNHWPSCCEWLRPIQLPEHGQTMYSSSSTMLCHFQMACYPLTSMGPQTFIKLPLNKIQTVCCPAPQCWNELPLIPGQQKYCVWNWKPIC